MRSSAFPGLRDASGLGDGSVPKDTLSGPPVFHPEPVHAADAMARASQRLRVLVVSSAPLGDDVPLDLRREWLLLQKEARDGLLPAAFFRLLPPTRRVLQSALSACQARRVAPHVLHFAGHGQVASLAFEDDLCRHAPLVREDLAKDLAGRGVRLVVLNACHTATRETVSLARYLVDQRAVDAAIGHEAPVADAAAALFAAHVYRGLCRGRTVYQAFVAAQGALGSTHPEAAASAKLFGGETLAFTDIASEPAAPLLFGGTTGRGRMPEIDHFFGRAAEIVAIGRFFEDTGARALALTGIGGIGKTALAMEAANRHSWRFPGGVAFASVRSFVFGKPTAEGLAKIAAAALLLPEASGSALVEHLLGHLQKHPALLVFDNLEDLADDELQRLLRLLEQLPLNGSKALLTMRPAPELLREWSWLLVQPITTGLAPRAGAGFAALVAQAKNVPEIASAPMDDRGVRQGLPLYLTLALGGHPKMIEVAVGLAAGRGVGVLRKEVPEIDEVATAKAAHELAAEAMEKRYDELLSTSMRLLGEDGRWLLSLLQVFPSPTFARDELDAAARGALEVPGEDMGKVEEALKRVTAGLSDCVAAGLVDRDAVADLFRVHATVSAHTRRQAPFEGAEAVRAFGGLLGLALRFATSRSEDYDAVERRLVHLFGVFEAGWLSLKEAQHAIARAVDDLGYFLYRRGHWSLMARWRDRLAGVPDEGPKARSHRLYKESLLVTGQGRLAEAAALLRETIQISNEIGNRKGRAASLHQLAIIECCQGNHGEAQILLRESLQIKDEIGDRPGRGASVLQLAIIEHSQGNYSEARALLCESLQIADEMGDRRGRAASLHQLAIIECNQGNYVNARVLLRESMQIADESWDRPGRGVSLCQLAIIDFCQGNYGEARALLRESLQIAEETENRTSRAASLHQLAIIECRQGNYGEARALLRESIQIKDGMGDRKGRAASLHQLAGIEYGQGNHGEARALLRESSQIEYEIGDRKGRASSLLQLATIESSQGNHAAARTLLRESSQIEYEIGDRQARASSLHQLAIIESRQGNHGDAQALLRESIQIKNEIGDRQGRAASLVMLGEMEVACGRAREGRGMVEEAANILEEIGSGEAAKVREFLAAVDAPSDMGNHRAGADPRGESELPTSDARAAKAALDSAADALRHGRPDDALSVLHAAQTDLSRPDARAAARSIEAQALFLLGRFDESFALLDTAVDEAAGAGIRFAVEALQQLRDQLQQMHQVTALAEMPLEQLESAASSPADLAVLLCRKAVAVAKVDRADEARTLLSRALAEVEASGHPLAQLEVRLNGAMLLAGFGEKDAARRLVTEARPLANVHARHVLGMLEDLDRKLAGG